MQASVGIASSDDAPQFGHMITEADSIVELYRGRLIAHLGAEFQTIPKAAMLIHL